MPQLCLKYHGPYIAAVAWVNFIFCHAPLIIRELICLHSKAIRACHLVQSGQAISCPLRCLPLEVVANQDMRHLVNANFPPLKQRSGKAPGSSCSLRGEERGQSVPRSRSNSARSRSMVTDTLDLDKLPWHIYEKCVADFKSCAVSCSLYNGAVLPKL